MSKFAITALGVLTILSLVIAGAPLAQAHTNAQAACVETYTVVAGDFLSTIAEKYLGDLKAYPQIVEATNNAAKTDPSFKTIADPNIIEVGQKLCIPAKAAGTTTTPAANTTPSATITPGTPVTVTVTAGVTVSPTTPAATATVTATAPTTTTVATTPTPAPGSLEGTYIKWGPAADASGLLTQLFLAPNSNASWLDNYVGKGTINSTGVWAQTGETRLALTLIKQDGRNIKQEFTFDIQGGNLVATQYDQGLYGESGITFYRADGTVKGTVSYVEKIALPEDAVYEVYLVDVTDATAPGIYISGISNRTNGDQVPLAFELPYASSQLKPDGKYVVQAFISSNGKLLFKNDSGVAVITNGAPTSAVQVVVAPPAQ